MDLYKIAVEATNMKIQKDQAFANNALDYQKLISTQEERIRAIILPVLKAGADQLSKAGIESSVVHHIQKDNDRPRVSLKLTFNGRSEIIHFTAIEDKFQAWDDNENNWESIGKLFEATKDSIEQILESFVKNKMK